jgi:hypothetical protein
MERRDVTATDIKKKEKKTTPEKDRDGNIYEKTGKVGQQ